MIRFIIVLLCTLCTSQFLKGQVLSPEKFQQQLQKEKGVLIDVRTTEEFNAEKISGAINMNVNDTAFAAKINTLDKSKYYFLYCGIGKRSAKAAAIMKGNGFEKVFDLEKGLAEWKARGLPTIKSDK